MTHVETGTLQALADDQLDAEQRHRVERHLHLCAVCSSELEILRAHALHFSGAVLLLDRPAPRSRDYAVGWPRRTATAPRLLAALPRAAVLVLGFAAAAAAAMPGSPVRRWVAEWRAPAAVEAPAPVAERAAAPVAREAVAEAGVSVVPVEGAVRVVLRDAAPEMRLRALISSAERAGVFATGPAADARFQTAPGRIEVEGLTGGDLRIELPRGARVATVEVNGREYLRKEGDQLRLAVPAQQPGQAEVLFRP